MQTPRWILAAALVAGLLAAAPAATGGEATLDDADGQVRWSGGPVGGLTAVPEACVPGSCDEFVVHVGLGPDAWIAPGGLQVGIRWGDEADDLDLYVYGPDGASSASSTGIDSTAESVLLPSAPDGAYRVVVATAGAQDATYEGVVEVERAPAREPIRDLLPDLVSLPSRNLRVQTSAYFFDVPVPSAPGGCYPEETAEQGARRCLRFDQIIGNTGDGALELRYRLDGAADTRSLLQRVTRSDGSHRERFADTYEFHPTHAHFHYVNFARSHLWASDDSGAMLGAAPVRSGNKNGFCLIDVENVSFGLKGDAARRYVPPACLLPTALDPGASEASMVGGISAGWADVYQWYLPGQYIEISGLADGYYVLETVADPAHTVEELNQTNNTSFVHVRLCGDRAEVVGGEQACQPA